jgi:DNA adenine methylase
MDIQKPILKWVGGKTQIITQIIDRFPKEIDNYHEPFIGGGSVLLAVLTLQKNNKIKINGKIYAYDLNNSLIHVYLAIQKKHIELYSLIEKHHTLYDSLTGNIINRKPKNLEEANTSKESYYYYIRHCYNSIDKSTVEGSALFIVLNKLCFRGMYRESKDSNFNVPYGHYRKTPTITTIEELTKVSDLIKNVIFTCSGFSDSLKNVNKGDFVYLDPPYVPENVNSFVGYTGTGFSSSDHMSLFTKIIEINKTSKIMMSNSKTDIIFDTFGKIQNFNIFELQVKRAINSKNPGSKTMEVIVSNYIQ